MDRFHHWCVVFHQQRCEPGISAFVYRLLPPCKISYIFSVHVHVIIQTPKRRSRLRRLTVLLSSLKSGTRPATKSIALTRQCTIEAHRLPSFVTISRKSSASITYIICAHLIYIWHAPHRGVRIYDEHNYYCIPDTLGRSRESFESARGYLVDLHANAPECRVVLVGNKVRNVSRRKWL